MKEKHLRCQVKKLENPYKNFNYKEQRGNPPNTYLPTKFYNNEPGVQLKKIGDKKENLNRQYKSYLPNKDE
jgi:hypothetical protein